MKDAVTDMKLNRVWRISKVVRASMMYDTEREHERDHRDWMRSREGGGPASSALFDLCDYCAKPDLKKVDYPGHASVFLFRKAYTQRLCDSCALVLSKKEQILLMAYHNRKTIIPLTDEEIKEALRRNNWLGRVVWKPAEPKKIQRPQVVVAAIARPEVKPFPTPMPLPKIQEQPKENYWAIMQQFTQPNSDEVVCDRWRKFLSGPTG